MTSCGSDLTQTQSHTSGELPEDGPFKIQSPLADISSIAESHSQIQGAPRPDFPEGEVTSGAEGEAAGLKTGGDTASTTSDTERSDDGKDKDTKKIQTTATTQVCVIVSGVWYWVVLKSLGNHNFLCFSTKKLITCCSLWLLYFQLLFS